MKVKVLTYAQDGNTVVRPYMELKELFQENQNIFQGREHDYGQVEIVFRRNNTYMVAGQVNKESIDSRKGMILDTYKNFCEGFENELFIKQLYIEFYKDAGLDASLLERIREKHLKEREEKEIQRQKEKAEAAKKLLEETAQRVEENLLKLSKGAAIRFDELVEIIDTKKIKVHPRTKMVILEQPNHFEISTTQGTFNKKKSSSCQGVFDLVKSIAKG